MRLFLLSIGVILLDKKVTSNTLHIHTGRTERRKQKQGLVDWCSVGDYSCSAPALLGELEQNEWQQKSYNSHKASIQSPGTH